MDSAYLLDDSDVDWCSRARAVDFIVRHRTFGILS